MTSPHSNADRTQEIELARLGRVEDRGEIIKKSENAYCTAIIPSWILRTTGLFVMVNSIVPDEHRVFTNIGAGFYALGGFCKDMASEYIETSTGYRLDEVRERLGVGEGLDKD